VRLVGYIRKSSKRDVDNGGSSLAIQERAIRAWCRRSEARLVDVRVDDGVSGTLPWRERPGLAAAMREVEQGRADGIVVHELDRFSRDMLVQEMTFADLWRFGDRERPPRETIVRSTMASEEAHCQRNDPLDPGRQTTRMLVGVLADHNRRVTIAKLQRGKAAKREAGGFIGGQVPLGYRVVGDPGKRELVADPKEAATLARIHELMGQGLSLRQIARQLEAEGHHPKRSAQWHPESLRKLLARIEVGATSTVDGRVADA